MTRYRSRKCESCERIFDLKVTNATVRDLWKCEECRVAKVSTEAAIPVHRASARALWATSATGSRNGLNQAGGGSGQRGGTR